MNGRHLRVVAAFVTLVAAGALTVAALGAPPESQQPTEVLKWNSIAMSTLLAATPPAVGGVPPGGGGVPPAASVHLGMTQGAVYDAVNATEPKHYRPYLLKRRFSARASGRCGGDRGLRGPLKHRARCPAGDRVPQPPDPA